MQTQPPLPASPQSPPPGGDAFSRFVERYIIEGFKTLPGRIKSSPKPEPLKWYDRFPVVFTSLVLFWPLGVVCVWLTKRFETADKMRLTAAGFVWGLLFTAISSAPATQARNEQTPSNSFERQLAVLSDVGESSFGSSWFKGIDNKGDAKEAVQFMQVQVQPPDLDSKSICRGILKFFQGALEKRALDDVEFVTFHFRADLVFQDGKEANMEVLRIALSRKTIQTTNWTGYDEYLHLDLVKRQLLSQADDTFFISKLDWRELGWRG